MAGSPKRLEAGAAAGSGDGGGGGDGRTSNHVEPPTDVLRHMFRTGAYADIVLRLTPVERSRYHRSTCAACAASDCLGFGRADARWHSTPTCASMFLLRTTRTLQ